MPIKTVHLLGAGGHCRVVIDALLCCGWTTAAIRVRDDRAALAGLSILGCRVETPVRPGRPLSGKVHAAVGSGAIRESLLLDSTLARRDWLAIVHPRASVAASATLGEGVFVAAQAVVGPCARIGAATIVNHGAVVDHDCSVGDFCHVAPLASLGGGVQVGRGVLIGAGARVLPEIRIGDGVVIGAGAVVIGHVPPGQTWQGVPAQPSHKGQ
ncbi:NeuD/PglB/VioB family sugar acetyltransferase [Accumulibacter sp.]|uniref:NeuD/PglB/VioB family sugar acetyltransferase n=1 Tax=Accumulibacter sp. TaxID=2053492 RepID=UPI0026140983|nr:NeuD/PglB/VioB family sugar acetyltransferase [Accumulibacter sp.]